MYGDGDLVTIENLVSRVEALCLADMLNAEGIAVHIVGNAHASVEVIPLALGGLRVRVPVAQYEQAGELIAEVGLAQNWTFGRGLQRAVARVIGTYFTVTLGILTLAASVTPISLAFLAMVPLSVLSVPASPQGRGEYYVVGGQTA